MSSLGAAADAVLAQAPQANPQGVFLRVSAEKVDRLMDLVGELSLGVSAVIHSVDQAGLELSEFETSAHRLKMVVREVQDTSAQLRLVPIGDVFRRMGRMVRELERQTGKKIQLTLRGEDTEIDKVVADRLYEPLVHVVRNCADHGLEQGHERLAQGKPEAGCIALSAAQVGSEIQITIADDGRGLHREKILARARARGLVGPTEEPEDSSLWKVIFEPGFSTAETVTNLSGRGVGMDVLNTTIKDLRGRIAVSSSAGQGTEVKLSIPLSVAFLDSLVVRVDRRLYALPMDVVNEVLRPQAQQISTVSADNGAELIRVRGQMVPVCRLPCYYGEHGERVPLAQQVVVIINTRHGLLGIPVDEMVDQQQVVMKPLQGQLQRIRASLGYALLGNGEVAVVLDADSLSPQRGRA